VGERLELAVNQERVQRAEQPFGTARGRLQLNQPVRDWLTAAAALALLGHARMGLAMARCRRESFALRRKTTECWPSAFPMMRPRIRQESP
jgi:hypothetical protein